MPRERASYDESGNLVATELLDAAGKPIDVKKFGRQRFTCRYDDRGNCVEPAFWNANGSPVYRNRIDQSSVIPEDCFTTIGGTWSEALA